MVQLADDTRGDGAGRVDAVVPDPVMRVSVAAGLGDGRRLVLVEPEQREPYLAGGVSVVEEARCAPGCLDLTISAYPIDAARIIIVERWEYQASVEAFRGSDATDEQTASIRCACIAECDVARVRALT